MKKYVKSSFDSDYDKIKFKLENNLYDLIVNSFEDNLALRLSGKSGYDASFAPESYDENSAVEKALDEARAEYISKLADNLLVNYSDEVSVNSAEEVDFDPDFVREYDDSDYYPEYRVFYSDSTYDEEFDYDIDHVGVFYDESEAVNFAKKYSKENNVPTKVVEYTESVASDVWNNEDEFDTEDYE